MRNDEALREWFAKYGHEVGCSQFGEDADLLSFANELLDERGHFVHCGRPEAPSWRCYVGCRDLRAAIAKVEEVA